MESCWRYFFITFCANDGLGELMESCWRYFFSRLFQQWIGRTNGVLLEIFLQQIVPTMDWENYWSLVGDISSADCSNDGLGELMESCWRYFFIRLCQRWIGRTNGVLLEIFLQQIVPTMDWEN